MSNLVKNRSELLFMYDVKDANPNGDPLDENKPRIDEETGINLVHVPYKGPPQVLTDLIAGQIQLAFDVIATSLPHVKSGKLRALAVSGAKRSAILPDMPTVAETVPGFNVLGWQGFLAPKGTPREINPQSGDQFTILEKWMDLDSQGNVTGVARQEFPVAAPAEP
jgi:hypothetical protein